LAPRDSIFFNNREYASWSSARDRANMKLATAKAGTVWGRARIESVTGITSTMLTVGGPSGLGMLFILCELEHIGAPFEGAVRLNAL
jgi:hypothetical protein